LAEEVLEIAGGWAAVAEEVLEAAVDMAVLEAAGNSWDMR
jgi:hypothetical protein